jgi:hypothetical protein
MLRNRKITDYIVNHSAAYEEFVTTVEEIPRHNHLPTPASTPCHTDLSGEQTFVPLPSQQIAQEEELDPDNQTDQHRNLSVEPHDQSSPAVQQEPNQRSRPLCYVYVEDADDSETEQPSSSTQPSANLDVWPQSDDNDDSYD